MKKRGLVVIVLFLLSIVSVVGDVEVEWTKYKYLYADKQQDSNSKKQQSLSKTNDLDNSVCEGVCGGNIAEPPAPDEGTGSGCMILMIEQDEHWCPIGWDADECSAAYVENGYVITSHQYNSLSISGKFDWGDDGGGEVDNLWNDEWKVSETPVLCNNERWHVCESKNLGEMIGVEKDQSTQPFLCLPSDDEGYRWVEPGEIDESVDQDEDGVPDAFDCAPENDEVYGFFPVGCNLDSDDDLDCFNSDVKEICGDGIDNDCSDWDGAGSDFLVTEHYKLSVNYDYENSDDDCDDFEYRFACKGENDKESLEEDSEDATQGHCLKEDGSCDWLPLTEDTGICCGDDGIYDVGIKEDNPELGSFLCMNDNYGLGYVRTAGGSLPGCTASGEGWCWVDASRQDVRNKIYTVSVPGQYPYDYVSTGENWFECKDGTSDQTPNVALQKNEYISSANRFYCYKQGERYAWSDCNDPGKEVGTGETAVQENSIKGRTAGDGLYSINLELHIDPLYPNILDIDMKGDDNYKEFYGDSPISISETDFMHIFFEFSKIKKDSKSQPIDLTLLIQGGNKVNNEFITYMKKSILGYAVNNPILEEGRTIHLKVPLFDQNFVNVKIIKLLTNGENEIEVSNIYFSNEDNPMVCSGEQSNILDETSWLTNYDQVGNTITGENICNRLFDPSSICDSSGGCEGNAWLGDDVLNPERRCCGDDPHEYYAGKAVLEE